jgi:hypothetical protein
MLPFGRLHVKHAVQRELLDTNSAFALGPRETTENPDLVSRREREREREREKRKLGG